MKATVTQGKASAVVQTGQTVSLSEVIGDALGVTTARVTGVTVTITETGVRTLVGYDRGRDGGGTDFCTIEIESEPARTSDGEAAALLKRQSEPVEGKIGLTRADADAIKRLAHHPHERVWMLAQDLGNEFALWDDDESDERGEGPNAYPLILRDASGRPTDIG